MKTDELATVAARVEQAPDYLDVFGSCDGNSATQTRHVKHVYRQLARVLHPDRYTDPDEQLIAKSGFTRLGELLIQAEQALKEGIYGQPVVLVSIVTRKAEHQIITPLQDGDLSQNYAATSKLASGLALTTFCKVAKSPADNDLFQAEAAALKRLHGPDTDANRHPFVSELVDAFSYAEKGKPRRQANVLTRLEGFYTLRQVRQAFPNGVAPLDMAWIWRRLLVALGFAHDNNVVHGAVLPNHVMIMPPQHGIVLVDWCYASLGDDNDYPPIKAIVDAYKDWYPEEVLNKQTPSPATDLTMAARCMIYLMGGNPLTGNLPEAQVPKAFRAFFKGCLQTKQAARPSDAWQLLGEFDELLEYLGPPYFPRRFRPFAMPTGTA